VATTITITIEGDQHTISTEGALSGRTTGDSSGEVVSVLNALKNGDFSARAKGALPSDGDISGVLNAIMAQHQQFAAELKQLTQALGTKGILGGQIEVAGAAGEWRQLIGHVNAMSANLTVQLRAMSLVLEAAANGDYTKKLVVDAGGETARLRDAVNRLTDRLAASSYTTQSAARSFIGDTEMPKLSGANEMETTIEVFEEIEPGSN
jgi:methyl-accepting chemotaxis protein